jgi:hypothetical protein
MCFALNLNKMFSIFSFFGKFIDSKNIIIGHKELMTIVAPSTACLLLFRGGCYILLIFYFTLVADFVSIWFLLTRFIFSHYLTPMPHALGPDHFAFINKFSNMQEIEFKRLSSIKDICAINRINFC